MRNFMASNIIIAINHDTISWSIRALQAQSFEDITPSRLEQTSKWLERLIGMLRTSEQTGETSSLLLERMSKRINENLVHR